MARWCTLDIPAKRTFTPISKISNEFVEVQGTFALRRISATEALNDHLERQQHGGAIPPHAKSDCWRATNSDTSFVSLVLARPRRQMRRSIYSY